MMCRVVAILAMRMRQAEILREKGICCQRSYLVCIVYCMVRIVLCDNFVPYMVWYGMVLYGTNHILRLMTTIIFF